MLDFSKLLNGSTRYNFHSHSQYCDGAGPLRDYVVEAVRQGFTHYGFSPHAPVTIPSECNMSFEDVPAYLAEVDALKAEFGDKIRLYASMEIDYLSPTENAANEYFSTLPMDYRMSSVHFLPFNGTFYDVDGPYDRFQKYVNEVFDGDVRFVTELFFDQSEAMVAAGGFDVIGHFDKIAQNASRFMPGLEDEAWYQMRLTRLIDAIAAAGITAEVNTKYSDSLHRIFPAARWLPQIIRAGIPLIINSDSHSPARISVGRSSYVPLSC